MARGRPRAARAARTLGAEHAYAVALRDAVPHLHVHVVPRFADTPHRWRGARSSSSTPRRPRRPRRSSRRPGASATPSCTARGAAARTRLRPRSLPAARATGTSRTSLGRSHCRRRSRWMGERGPVPSESGDAGPGVRGRRDVFLAGHATDPRYSGAAREDERMLILCKRDLTPDDFDRLGTVLAALPYPLRWSRRRGRLAILLDARTRRSPTSRRCSPTPRSTTCCAPRRRTRSGACSRGATSSTSRSRARAPSPAPCSWRRSGSTSAAPGGRAHGGGRRLRRLGRGQGVDPRRRHARRR